MNFDDQAMWNKDGSSGEFTGVRGGNGTTKAFFAGADDKDGTNAKFFALANGNIFHASIGQIVFSYEQIADFTDDDQAGLLVDTWTSSVTSPAGPTQTSGTNAVKVRKMIQHRFGIDTLTIQGNAKVRNPSGGGGTTDALITLTYGSASHQEQVVNSSASDSGLESFSFDLDVSGETPGDTVELLIRVQARVQGANSATDRFADLRNDVTVISST